MVSGRWVGGFNKTLCGGFKISNFKMDYFFILPSLFLFSLIFQTSPVKYWRGQKKVIYFSFVCFNRLPISDTTSKISVTTSVAEKKHIMGLLHEKIPKCSSKHVNYSNSGDVMNTMTFTLSSLGG